jgi:hypothetical protein
MAGRPLVATIYGWLSRDRSAGLRSVRLRRAFAVATLGWALVYAARATVQYLLYVADRPALLAASKIALGWPLTALALAVTLAYVRRAQRAG